MRDWIAVALEDAVAIPEPRTRLGLVSPGPD
jgi:hypothetical protein